VRIYLAAPLFTLAEQLFNQELARLIEAELSGAEVVLPQQRAKQLLQMPNGLELIFDDCLQTIQQSDVLVAVLDGADADSGTCIELGYAHCLRKPIVGVRTDFRASEDRGLNLMVSHICTALILASATDLPTLAVKIRCALDQVSGSPCPSTLPTG
jgi:nucleoside 2-deoxyribosyltransferase